MTGYGRSEVLIEDEPFFIEVKTLNHRYLDISLRMPDRFMGLDLRIREEVKKRFSRGSFTISMFLDSTQAPPFKVNIEAARSYLEAAEVLKKELGIRGEADVELLLKTREIFYSDRKSTDLEAAWGAVCKGLEAAFGQVAEWRKKEGANLEADLLERLSKIEALLSIVEERAPRVKEFYRERLLTEMGKVVKEGVDESRVLLEAAVFAERCDISEEITRIKSHAGMFRTYLASGEPAGKKLDFLSQELFREVNTIGSKANDATLAQTVVEMKWELEKIREQAQNIE